MHTARSTFTFKVRAARLCCQSRGAAFVAQPGRIARGLAIGTTPPAREGCLSLYAIDVRARLTEMALAGREDPVLRGLGPAPRASKGDDPLIAELGVLEELQSLRLKGSNG